MSAPQPHPGGAQSPGDFLTPGVGRETVSGARLGLALLSSPVASGRSHQLSGPPLPHPTMGNKKVTPVWGCSEGHGPGQLPVLFQH